jgi:hypothetical protein
MIHAKTFQGRMKASLVHLMLSACVAAFAALLVFAVWYPYPYREISGGRELFFIVVAVDVVMGPCLTFAVFNRAKPKRSLMLDVGAIAVLQLLALGYGLWTVFVARPVYLAYEVDRFRVVSVVDIAPGALKPEKGGFHTLPIWGPKVIGVRTPKDSDEMLRSLDLSMQGSEPSVRPDWWQSFEQNRAVAIARSKRIEELRAKQPSASLLIDKAVRDSGKTERELRWLPMTSFRYTNWVALVDAANADVLAFANVDGF